MIGLSATMAQDIAPAAATLSPEAHLGKVVGTVMTGLLLGILLSRVVSGFVAEHGALLRSLAHLWRRQGALRRSALAQGLLSVGFSAFWSTLAVSSRRP